MPTTQSSQQIIKKTQMNKKRAPLPSRVAKKFSGFKGLAIATYTCAVKKGSRARQGFIFLYPTIEKNRFMLPGDEIMPDPILVIKISTRSIGEFCHLVQEMLLGHFPSEITSILLEAELCYQTMEMNI